MGYHSQKLPEVFSHFKTSETGLTSTEAERRLSIYGRNTFSIEKKASTLGLILHQFNSLPVLILIIAAIVSYGITVFHFSEEDHTFDTILIIVILVANAVFGFFQEYKAEKTLEALKKLATPRATVLRDNTEVEINSEEVVPGDITLLKDGDIVPADSRLIESMSLAVDESMLTGESVAVEKKPDVVTEEALLAERTNMLFMNTGINRGKGRAVVVGTGLKTEVGKIAKELVTVEKTKSVFDIEIEDLGKKIAFGLFIIILLVVVVQILVIKESLTTIFLTGISLAVAAIPEALPIVLTISLAIGAGKMLEKNALMRKLSVIENFSSVDVICTDKTGTLTENLMTVTTVYQNGNELHVTGKGHETSGSLIYEGEEYKSKDLVMLLKCAILCNDAKFLKAENRFKGDPTEIAVLIPALKYHLDVSDIRSRYKEVSEVPFTSERKMMTSIHSADGKNVAYSKGAIEVLIEKCTKIYENGKARKLTKKDRDEILKANEKMAGAALRVLGFAFRGGVSSFEESKVEKDLVFLGLMGMIDPPRKGVLESLTDCRNAGIRVIMLTGDNKITANTIAKELGFKGDVLTGKDLDALSDKELAVVVEQNEIYARTDPIHKVRVLKALKKNRHVVAMTGDGVNDAPSLKNSDIGIAMGIRGTEISKEASDMVLLDDNFVSIRDSIEQGRGIADNIKKFVVYMLGANIAEVALIFLVSLLALLFPAVGLPLLSFQLLWINLLTDALPAVSLSFDRPTKGIMKRKPVKSSERFLIDFDAIHLIFSLALSATLVLLAIFLVHVEDNLRKAQTMVFTSFVVFEMVKIFLVRGKFNTDQFSNKLLYGTVFLSLILQLLVLYTPAAEFFKVVPLDMNDWLVIIAGLVSFIVLFFIVDFISSLFLRRFGRVLAATA